MTLWTDDATTMFVLQVRAATLWTDGASVSLAMPALAVNSSVLRDTSDRSAQHSYAIFLSFNISTWIRIHLAVLDPDPYRGCGSGSRSM